MTYDEWKLETPEDEAQRRGWRDYRDVERCWKCGEEFIEVEDDDEYRFTCSKCGADVLDAPPERDPDDARDEAQAWRWER